MNRTRSTAGLSALLGGVLLSSLALGDIGTVAAVNREMDGTPPQRPKRPLTLGDNVVSYERIETSTVGLGQLLFIDNTSLSVAPNSDIVLDKYVFDPDRQTGDIALTMTRGVMRFIGGRITKTKTATIRTPTATIGIRGGMVMIEIYAGITKVINIASEFVTVERYGDADGDGLDDGPGGESSEEGGDSDGDGEGTTAASGDESDSTTAESGDGTETTDDGSGESTTTTTVTSSEGTDDGTSEPLSRIVLTRTSSTATADDDGVTYSGIATTEDLSGIYGSLEGSGDGGLSTETTTATVEAESETLISTNSESTGATTNEPVTTDGSTEPDEPEPVSTDPNSETQESNSIAEKVASGLSETNELPPEIVDPNDTGSSPLPDPNVIASLTGFADYAGPATGTLFDSSSGAPVESPASGTMSLRYFFEPRNGTMNFDFDNGSFTLDVLANPSNAAEFSGNDVIFGGPDSVSATGGFRTGVNDPAASVEGTFNIDLQTQNQSISGTYTGTK